MGIIKTIKLRASQVLLWTWLLFVPALLNAASPDFTFMVTADFGPNGLKSNHRTMTSMVRAAKDNPPAFVLQLGDFFHQNGVSSTDDRRWKRLFEKRTRKLSPEIPWKGVLGNHEYRGNSQAILDYSLLNPRWEVPSRYYTFVCRASDSMSVRFVVFDTTPLISGYRKNQKAFPDAGLQDPERQLRWADSVLTSSKETLVIALGHHPLIDVSNFTAASGSDALPETSEPLMDELHNLLLTHHVDFYFSGHRHNEQYINMGLGGMQYVIVTSGSQPKPVRDSDGVRVTSVAAPSPALLFYRMERGFVQCTVNSNSLEVSFINTKQKITYSVKKIFSNKLP